jgi:hypothetical protein
MDNAASEMGFEPRGGALRAGAGGSTQAQFHMVDSGGTEP